MSSTRCSLLQCAFDTVMWIYPCLHVLIMLNSNWLSTRPHWLQTINTHHFVSFDSAHSICLKWLVVDSQELDVEGMICSDPKSFKMRDCNLTEIPVLPQCWIYSMQNSKLPVTSFTVMKFSSSPGTQKPPNAPQENQILVQGCPSGSQIWLVLDSKG